MNFLAHAYLSPPHPPGLLVGNLLADMVKGRARHALPQEVRAGLDLHRHIDGFTDTHLLVAQCGDLLADRWGRYAGVLVDIFFDHCLAAHWGRYSAVGLEEYVRQTYDAVRPYRELFPPRAQVGFEAMTQDDWLTSYARLEGVEVALQRLSRRLKHDIELSPAVEDFRRHEQAFHAKFAAFFPQLTASCREFNMQAAT